MEFRDHASRVRDPDQVLGALTYGFGVLLTAYTLYYAYARPISGTRHTNVFLGVGLALFYLMVARKYVGDGEEASPRPTGGRFEQFEAVLRRVDPFICIVLAALALASVAYIELNFVRLEREAFIVGRTQMDNLVGVVIITLAVDATRRAYGWVIAGVVIGSLAYAFGGPVLGRVPFMPDLFVHSGMSYEQVTRFGGMNLETGVYSFIMNVGATWVAIFIMFAGIAKVYGALDYILQVGRELGKKLQTGIVQVAVISSMAMGSITGSAAANTATTGSFTIPMMQDQGVADDFATAIESVASSGGQMMPPIMGVAAFLMADILDIPYLSVIRAGLLPAALFYFSVGVAVHLVVHRFGWTSDRSGAIDRGILPSGIVFLPAFVVLVVTLVALRLSPLRAGLYSIVTIVATLYLKTVVYDWLLGRGRSTEGETTAVGATGDDETGGAGEGTPDSSGVPTGSAEDLLGGLSTITRRTLDGFAQGAKDMAPLVSILASMGIIVALVSQTGLAQNISRGMIDLGAGILVVVLILAMITSILFGLGMPTPAAYILVVTLVAPALIRLAIPDIVAHMFVFYFAMLSAITPPVAVAVAVGARISGAGFMTASKQALRIGAAGFLIPFAFVTNQGLIIWTYPATLFDLLFVVGGVTALTVATTGFDGRRTLSRAERLLYVTLAVVAMYAPGVSSVLGGTIPQVLQAVAVTLVVVRLLQVNVLKTGPAVSPAGDRR